MIQTVFQWLISRKVDDGLPLGTCLSWIIKNDAKLRSYYETLLRLEFRLQHDASALLELSAKSHQAKSLRIVSRSVLYSNGKKPFRYRKALSVIGLTILFVFGAGLFFSAPLVLFNNGEKSAAAGQNLESQQPIAASIYSDPQIYSELLQLCRPMSNESDSFFVNSK